VGCSPEGYDKLNRLSWRIQGTIKKAGNAKTASPLCLEKLPFEFEKKLRSILYWLDCQKTKHGQVDLVLDQRQKVRKLAQFKYANSFCQHNTFN
jgi:hypothetical protein